MLHVYGLILETRFTQFFSSFLFVTALAAYTNAKLFHRLIFSSAVHIYVFSHPHFYMHPSFRAMSGTNSRNDQLPVGLIAQSVGESAAPVSPGDGFESRSSQFFFSGSLFPAALFSHTTARFFLD